MSNKYIKEVNKFFNKYYNKYGDDSRSVVYSEKGQLLRFNALTKNLDLTGLSILDVGSGLGHMVEYLKKIIKTLNILDLI